MRPGEGVAGRQRALGALCVSEFVSWGALYYFVPATLPALAAQSGWSSTAIMGSFTVGLLAYAAAAVPVGRVVDAHGPRGVMTAGSLLGAAALVGMAASPTLGWFTASWILAGVAQACLLYPPAFAALTRWYGEARVRPLTVVSLVGGLSSTVFAPLNAVLVESLGWRQACLVLAVVLALVTTPLHLGALNLPWPADEAVADTDRRHLRRTASSPAFRRLALALALASLGIYATTTNIVALLVERGMDATTAAVVLGLCGAGQLLGRIGFPALSRRTRPSARTTSVFAFGALGAAGLAISPAAVVPATAAAVVAGAGRGAFTLVQATAVPDRWGTRDVATLNALATTPSAVAMALGPVVGAGLATGTGGYAGAAWILAGVVAVGALIATVTATR